MTKTRIAKAYAKIHRTRDWNAPLVSIAKKRKILKERLALNDRF